MTAEPTHDAKAPDIAVSYHGVDIPPNPHLGEDRIRAIRRGRYEAQEIMAALRVIGPDDRVLELGSGLGIVGSVIARNCTPEHVESYEANPALIPIIETLHAANGLENIGITHAVVSVADDPPATLPFYIHGSFLGSSLRPRRRARDVVDVPVVPFDRIRNTLRPTAIVMDIEGAEHDLLRGMDLSGVRCVSFEMHPPVYGSAGIDGIFAALMGHGLSYDPAASFGPVVTFRRG